MRTCPVPDCSKALGGTEVLCRDHWEDVPEVLWQRVREEYARWPGSPEHIRVTREAIASVVQGRHE